MAIEDWLRLASFTHWVKHNICTYQRGFLLLTASYGVSTQNPERWTDQPRDYLNSVNYKSIQAWFWITDFGLKKM